MSRRRFPDNFRPVIDTTKPRFVTEEQLVELSKLYHLARTALCGRDENGNRRDDSKPARIRWAVDAFCKEHPEIKSLGAYKDLEASVYW